MPASVQPVHVAHAHDTSRAARQEQIRIWRSSPAPSNAHGIRYTVGGSLASSFSGEPRSSIDADIVTSESGSGLL